MKQKITLAVLLFTISLNFQSCMSTVAGILNQEIIDQTEDNYVNNEIKRIAQLNLSEDQLLKANKVFSEAYTEKRDNAHREKSKEISKKASFNNLKYIIYKNQVKFERILNKEQLIASRQSNYGLNADQLKKLKNDVSKMGYSLSF
ncbi:MULTISPECIES: hypothetical protein [unclassified Lacinutrix]